MNKLKDTRIYGDLIVDGVTVLDSLKLNGILELPYTQKSHTIKIGGNNNQDVLLRVSSGRLVLNNVREGNKYEIVTTREWTTSQFAPKDHDHNKIMVQDVRSFSDSEERSFNLTPSEIEDKSVSAYFAYNIDGLIGWRSLLTVKGWTGNTYSSWQLIGDAGTSTDNRLYFRTGVQDTWNALLEVIHSGNIHEHLPKNLSDLINDINAPSETWVKEQITNSENTLKNLINSGLNNKVDKVSGKGLSTNDFTNDLKSKLESVETGAQKNTVHSVNNKKGDVKLGIDDIPELNERIDSKLEAVKFEEYKESLELWDISLFGVFKNRVELIDESNRLITTFFVDKGETLEISEYYDYYVGGVEFNYETPITEDIVITAVEREFPRRYILATDDDFSGSSTGSFKYIGSDDFVIIPKVIKGIEVTSSREMFRGTSVKGVATYKDNKITDMSNMFYETSSLTLETKFLRTRNVSIMSYMFSRSKSVVLDLQNLETEKVTLMSAMFMDCPAKEILLKGIKTPNLKATNYMFQNTYADILDLSTMDFSGVTNSGLMFNSSKVRVVYVSNSENFDIINNSSNKPKNLQILIKGE